MKTETSRITLITAQVEGLVSHDRLKQITTEHPADLTKLLSQLVRDGFLEPDGAGRGTVYFLPGQLAGIGAAFQGGEAEIGPLALTPEPGRESPELATIPPELGEKPPELVIYQDLASVPPSLRDELARLAEAIAHKPRVKPELMREALVGMCKGRYLGLRVLADLVHRHPDDLCKRFLAPLVKTGVLRAAYPSPRDPRQAYTSAPRSA